MDPYDIEKFEHKYYLKDSQGLIDFDIQVIEEIEYLSTAEDVLHKKCFGQNDKVKQYVWEQCLEGVEKIFNKNAVSKGLKVINYRHIVTAKTNI